MKANNFLTSTPQPIRLHVPDFQRVAITLVGTGGTGSHLSSGLVAIQQALSERGIACDVTLIDRDIVEEKNVGRQLFDLPDIGGSKAHAIANRLNAAFGTRFGALARAITREDTFRSVVGVTESVRDVLNVVIGAVDNPAARALIANAVRKANGALWHLDCGNEKHSGQIALGNVAIAQGMIGAVALGMTDRLPAPALVYPDIVKTIRVKKSRRVASCAELTASGEQGLMVNRVIAAYACELLSAFLVQREVRWFALDVDLRWGGTHAYALDVPTLAAVTGLKADQMVAKGKESR